MKPIQNCPEDNCSKAHQLRRVCFREFDGKQHCLHLERCFAELRKAIKASEAWQQHKSFLNLKSRPPKILGPLDAIAIPGPSIFETLLDKLLPDTIISQQMSKFELFQMRRLNFNLTSGSVSFKPLFSRQHLALPVSEYICITLTTKMVLLLLEVAQLDFWAARFYKGLGYARVAQEFSAALVNQFPRVSQYSLLLHHAVTYVVLTGICVLVTQEHQNCFCCMQFGEVARSCQNLFNAVKDVGLLINEGCFEKFLSQNCWLGDLFVECLALTNANNLANVITRRRIIAFSVYLEITRHIMLKGPNPLTVFDLGQTLVKVFSTTDRQYESDVDYFVQALKCYVIGCSHSILSSIKGYPRRGDSDEDAEALFQNCTLHLKAIGRAEFYQQARYQTLYNKARTAETISYLRCCLRQVHDQDPSLRLNVCNYLREFRKEHLAIDKMLDPSIRDELLTGVSLISLYLSDTVNKLMSYKKGKHIDKLRDGLKEAKKTLRFLLPVEANSSFCRFLLSDLVKHWNWSEQYHSYSCFDLDPILIIVKGMTIVARAAKHRKQEAIVKHRKPEAVMEHCKRFNDGNHNRKSGKRDCGEAIAGDGGVARKGNVEKNGLERAEEVNGFKGGENGTDLEEDKKLCLEVKVKVDDLQEGKNLYGLHESKKIYGLHGNEKIDGLNDSVKVDGLQEGDIIHVVTNEMSSLGNDFKGFGKDFEGNIVLATDENIVIMPTDGGAIRGHEEDAVEKGGEDGAVEGGEEGGAVEGGDVHNLVVVAEKFDTVVADDNANNVEGAVRENSLLEKTIVESARSTEIINRQVWDELNKLIVLYDGINFKECYEIYGTIETALERGLTTYVVPLPNEIDASVSLRAPAPAHAPTSPNAPTLPNAPAPSNAPAISNVPAPSTTPAPPNKTAHLNAPTPQNEPASPYAPAPPNAPAPSNASTPPNSPTPTNAPTLNAPTPTNVPAPPNAPDLSAKTATKARSIRHKRRVATNSPRSEPARINHTDEQLPPQPKCQRLAMEYLFYMDYSDYVEEGVYTNVSYTRGSVCWEELKKLACQRINKALMNEKLVGSPTLDARSESSEDSTEESLKDRLEEALQILCEVPGNARKILEGIVEVSDVLGIRTEFDNEEHDPPTSGRML